MCLVAQLESNGDPWQNYPDVDAASVNYFWDYVYFVLIVLTTIGFGDISPVTTLGKLFLVFYVLLCLVSWTQISVFYDDLPCKCENNR